MFLCSVQIITYTERDVESIKQVIQRYYILESPGVFVVNQSECSYKDGINCTSFGNHCIKPVVSADQNAVV